MAKIVLKVEYEGTRYHGFQYQENAASVQAEVERALMKLTGEALRVIGASRTDAGVHARGQVVSFRTNAHLPPQTWVRALNYYLPWDIAVKAAWPVADDFDVRRGAISREYRYSVLNSATRSPFHHRFAYHFPRPLDIAAMQQASQLLEGEHDFASFSPAAKDRPGRTVRQVFHARMKRQGDLIFFDVSANSFLPHQVRHTVGALLRVGSRRLDIDEFRRIAEARIPGLAGPAAPPQGLCLMQVSYPQPIGESSDENL